MHRVVTLWTELTVSQTFRVWTGIETQTHGILSVTNMHRFWQALKRMVCRNQNEYKETLTDSCWNPTNVLLEKRGMPLLLYGLHMHTGS